MLKDVSAVAGFGTPYLVGSQSAELSTGPQLIHLFGKGFYFFKCHVVLLGYIIRFIFIKGFLLFF